jgi:hypothetical protein
MQQDTALRFSQLKQPAKLINHLAAVIGRIFTLGYEK